MASRDTWTYVSGLVAVEETRLLDDGALQDFGRSGDLDRLRRELRQMEAYQGLAAAAEADGWRTGLETVFVRRVRELAESCPESDAATVFLVNYDYQRLRQFVHARVATAADIPAPYAEWTEDDLQRAWDGTYDSLPGIGRVAEEVSLALALGGAEPGRIVDLVLDRCELEAFRSRARALESALIDEWTEEYVLLRAALAVARARAAGDDAVNVLRRDLLTGPLADEWLRDLTERPMSELGPALAERVGSQAEDRSIERLAVDADDWLTEMIRGAKSAAFGPERVFGYAWGLSVENVNLRLIVQAAELGLPADAVGARIRRSYV